MDNEYKRKVYEAVITARTPFRLDGEDLYAYVMACAPVPNPKAYFRAARGVNLSYVGGMDDPIGSVGDRVMFSASPGETLVEGDGGTYTPVTGLSARIDMPEHQAVLEINPKSDDRRFIVDDQAFPEDGIYEADDAIAKKLGVFSDQDYIGIIDLLADLGVTVDDRAVVGFSISDGDEVDAFVLG